MPTKTDIWMPIYIGDLVADTTHLSRADFGSYLLLIFLYWRRRGPLPDDDNALSEAARVALRDLATGTRGAGTILPDWRRRVAAQTRRYGVV